jgi:DNA-binding transcriptional regulator YiaG
MDLIVCTTCGRPIAQPLDAGADLRGTCSACLPNPVDMLRFSIALQTAREVSGHKAEYCAARLRVARKTWYQWEVGQKRRPPYNRRDALLALFADTPAAPIMLAEVQAWPK